MNKEYSFSRRERVCVCVGGGGGEHAVDGKLAVIINCDNQV